MKKIIFFVFALSFTLTLFGCSQNWDNDYAYAEVTHPNGVAIVLAPHGEQHYSNRMSYAVEHGAKFSVKNGDVVTIHFHCDQCGYDENVELVSPFAKLLSCECEENLKEGIIKEYISILAAEIEEDDKE